MPSMGARVTARRILPAALLLAALTLSACDQREAANEPLEQPLSVAEPLAAPEPGEVRVQQTAEESPTSAGALLYAANCDVCHGVRGGGGLGPALAGNQNLQNADYVVGRILLGGGGMPPFAPRLTAAQIAAVATHERTSWGNSFGAIDAQKVEVQWSGLRAGSALGGGQGQSQPQQAQAQGTQQGQVDGEQIYTQAGCAGCHGQNGEGGVGPALAGNQNLENAQMMIQQILNGGGGMPAFAEQLTPEQIAAVATYERTSWGNSFGEVSTEQVRELSSGAQDQAQPNQPSQDQQQAGGEQQGQQAQQPEGQQNQQQGAQGQAQQSQSQQNQPLQGQQAQDQTQQPPQQPEQSGPALGAQQSGQQPNQQAAQTSQEQQPQGQPAQQTQQQGVGGLEITVEPANARLTVIGPDRYVHFAVLSGGAELMELKPGRYTVSATKSGYQLAYSQIDLAPGQTASVSLTLQPLEEQSSGQSQQPPNGQP